jgi:glutathione S-transferase
MTDFEMHWGARQAMGVFTTRLGLVTHRLERAPYLAGDAFTAADISVGYALEMARKNVGVVLGDVEQAYMARLRVRAGYRRALAACHATRGWWMS